MYIAVLLTCHNRRKKTVSCLSSLKAALAKYNAEKEGGISLEIFLTDDGSTDGTADAAREIFPDEKVLHILQGDGNLYWARGMHYAWSDAQKQAGKWDFYLLLNDDVVLMGNVFEELLTANDYSMKNFGKQGLYSGQCCDPTDHNKRTFGGHVWVNRFKGTTKVMLPTGKPELCDITNANILMVSPNVVDVIGIFNKGFRHGGADYSYSIHARDKGFPVLLTANFCGECEFDHMSSGAEKNKIINMSLKERKAYFRHPLHSAKDRLLCARIETPLRYPFVLAGIIMNIYCPKLYYKIMNLK
jgi:GT2 family glycosyltransferase